MTKDQWQRVKRLAADALAQPEPDRAAFVASACGSDGWLRGEVQSLLASVERAAPMYETALFDAASVHAVVDDIERAAAPLIGRRIGSYRVVRELGRGGMGAAYLAERDDQAFEKRVAIKLIKRGMDTDAILRRFRHERQILADLNHPNIATLLDGGTTDDGRPYFVIEYVEGLPIDIFCEQQELPLRARLELFRQVCTAVHYANENRVVHRDLKPGNILVTPGGAPKLLDFGIAKLLSATDAPPAVETAIADLAMTPQYASPEQVQGGPITPASDVYSLGVLLYVLTTGRLPYRLEGRTPAQAERIVCDEEPTVPSAVFGGVAQSPEGRRRQRDLEGDIDAIAMTALHKEPARRYPSAQALADDVGRHLDGLPIAVRPRRVRDRLTRLARRTGTRAGGITAAAVLAALAIAVAMSANRRPGAPPGAPIASVAVLPLVNVAGDANLDFLAEGMTDGLINRLSGVPRLKVIAHDSVYDYKGSTTDYREIARQLDVRALVTGDVASSGNQVHVNVALIDAANRRRLWTARYDRALGEIQALQAEIAQTVAGQLRLELSPLEQARVRQGFTADPDAYRLYLMGRYVWNKRRTDDFRKSIRYFQQALERDPRFALAYSGLADAYGLLTEYHAEPATDTYTEAKRAANTALVLDGNLAEAHTSLAYVKQFYEWDWPGAEQGFRRAIALNPNYTTALQWFAEFLSAMGRHDEALAMIRRARQLDPLSLIVNSVEANILYMARRYDEAIAKSREVIEMDAEFPEVYEYLKRAYDQMGLYRLAIDARQARRRLLDRPAGETPSLRAAASTTDRRVYWRSRLEQELDEGKDEGLQPFEMAEIFAQAGDSARALEWLERACREHDFMVMYIQVAPNLDPLRGEPGFQKLLRRSCRL